MVGRLDLEAGPDAWPVTTLLAWSLTARRLVLTGEAAHTVSPLGAQGLNLSIADARMLAGLVGAALQAGQDPGGDSLLQKYQRARMPDIAARIAAIECYTLASGAARGPLAVGRRLGLGALSRPAPAPPPGDLLGVRDTRPASGRPPADRDGHFPDRE